MFYATAKPDHGLPHDPFKAIIAPRPIGWITSMSAKGEINLAPYSYFNGVRSRPPMVMFSSEGRKDSLDFVEETREFVCNLATWDLRHQMNQTSAPYPRGVNEITEAGLTAAPSRLVKPPRVAEAPAALECKWVQTIQLKDIDGTPFDGWMVIGRVVGVHIDERFIKNGLLDTAAMKPIARGGYHDYSVLTESFTMRRPDERGRHACARAGGQQGRLTWNFGSINALLWRRRRRLFTIPALVVASRAARGESGRIEGIDACFTFFSVTDRTAIRLWTPMRMRRRRPRRAARASGWCWAAERRAALPISACCAR